MYIPNSSSTFISFSLFICYSQDTVTAKNNLSQGIVFLLKDATHSTLLQLSWCPYGTEEGRRWKDRTSLLKHMVAVSPQRTLKSGESWFFASFPPFPYSFSSIFGSEVSAGSQHSLTLLPTAATCPAQELQAQHLLTTHMLTSLRLYICIPTGKPFYFLFFCKSPSPRLLNIAGRNQYANLLRRHKKASKWHFMLS